MFVYSPSNMATFKECARRFQAQSITKEIKWKATPSKSRGTLVHNAVERALRYGLHTVRNWPDGIDIDFTENQINKIRSFVALGGSVEIEQELTVSNSFTPTGWWDDDALIRAKADAIVFMPQTTWSPVTPHIKLIDIKTGKLWDTNDLQLRIEALLAHLIYQKPLIEYEYWYVDSGEPVDGFIDFTNGLSPVEDIITLMNDMRLAMENVNFPPTKNNFCRFCDLHKTIACGI